MIGGCYPAQCPFNGFATPLYFRRCNVPLRCEAHRLFGRLGKLNQTRSADSPGRQSIKRRSNHAEQFGAAARRSRRYP